MQFRVEDEARGRKESVSNNEIGIVPVSKMREQQLSASCGPRRKQATRREEETGGLLRRNRGPQKYSGQVSCTVEIRGENRLFLRGFTPSGAENSRLTGRRDANRVDRRYFGGLEGRRGENSCDYDRSCPTIDHQ